MSDKNAVRLHENMTLGEVYGPAMQITDPIEAKQYFEALVQRQMCGGIAREEAERIERCNLGYYAGYYGETTQKRVLELFQAEHPIFHQHKP